MNQSERRIVLIRVLLNEHPEYQELRIPTDADTQRQLLRGLLNIREPRRIGTDFLQIQDEYLQEETAAKGITDAADLVPLQPGLYLWQGDITTLKCDAIVNAANSGMTGCYCPNHGCIDNAIHTYAGVQLRLACAEIMDRQGHPEPTGQAKITQGHEVSPRNLPGRRRSPRHLICPAAMYCIRSDPSFPGGSQRRTKSCWPPATAPVWKWQRKRDWKVWRSAASLPESSIFPMSRRQRLLCRPSKHFSKSKPV